MSLMSLDVIPFDLLLKIASYITLEEYLRLSEVSVNINKCLTYGRHTETIRNIRREYIAELKRQLKMVKNDGLSIEKIENPSETIQLHAARERGHAIRYIKYPSEEVQLAAISNFSYSISYIENPSERVQLAAVKKSPYSIKCIKYPCKSVEDYLRKENIHGIDYR